MIYVLDSDTLIFMIRGLKKEEGSERRERATRIVKRCQEARSRGDSIGVSAISVSELEFGARSSDSYEKELQAVHKILQPFDTYDYDAIDCPVHYGRVRHDLKVSGLPIGSLDMLIAAHALSLGAILVTNNEADFSRIRGLKTVNWSTE